MNKEKIIKYNKNEYKQTILPVREAIMLRKQWTDSKGEIDELKMYDLVLENMFNNPYSLDDFTEVAEVDYICQQAIINQYAPSKGK